MIFAIRDDDLNYFSLPEQLESVYGQIWDECPISFSTVPFHGCTKTGAIPEKYWKGNATFPIANNEELTSFISEGILDNRICLTLHGYNHIDLEDGYEFESGEGLEWKVNEGKQYLEKTFNTEIRVFVPPHNSLGKEGLDAVTRSHLNIGGIVPLSNRYGLWKPKTIIPLVKKKTSEIINRGYRYPRVLDFGDHKEITCNGLIPRTRFEDLEKQLKYCHRKNGVFVLASHYWEYDEPCINHRNWKMKDVLYRFWNVVKKLPDIKFVSLNDVFN